MIEAHKTILRGVSDDQNLFRKELIKSLNRLNLKEQSNLKRWVMQEFKSQHPKIVSEVCRFSKDTRS